MAEPFGREARGAFAGAYPARPAAFAHGLAGHPLLTTEALARAAEALPQGQLEYNLGDIAIDQRDPAAVPKGALRPAEIIERIDAAGSWVALRNVEALPPYAALMAEVLEALRPVIEPATGPAVQAESFVFVSSPRAVTPFHMDPEHNVLCQVRGAKTMTVFPSDDPEVVPGPLHEAYHAGGHCNLPFDEAAMAPKGRAFALAPGDALHVPVKCPHHVRVGEAPSVSFSVTWRSGETDRHRRVHRTNALLRRAGLSPSPYGRHGMLDQAKAAAGRILDRIG